MTLQEVLEVLRLEKARLHEQYGLVRVGVFGSVARGEGRSDSDTDIVVEVPIADAWAYIELREELARLIGGRVDIVRLRPGMRASLRARIDAEAVYV